MEAVRKAGSHNIAFNGHVFAAPDSNDGYGYGITDFLKAYNILRYGDGDVFITDYATQDGIFSAMTVAGDTPDNVTAIPFEVVNGQVVYGKPINLKVKTSMEEKGFYTYEIKLPKLSKKQLYQLYFLKFKFGGSEVWRVVGVEQPVAP